MPNWTSNTLRMNGIGRKRELYDEEGYFDFNKIIPEPKTAEECIEKYGEEYIDKGNSHLEHTEENKWFDWYKWRCSYWGTKWNACYTHITTNDEVSFDTAWCEPVKVFEALSKRYPEEKLEVEAFYEGGIKVHRVYKNGELIEYSEHETEWEEEEE